jgi:hypothetical protein
MPSVHDLAHQSGFVFEAEVERLGASTASAFAATSETAVVRVTKIFKAPPALAQFAGQRVTVVLQSPVSLKAGQSASFFTHGLHYGDGLVVREVGNLPPEATMELQVNSAAQVGSDNELTQRLAQADLVITGVAGAPKKYLAGPTDPPQRVSEHDPDWWVSTLKVDSVEKGVHSGATKDILFPHSMDIAWHRSPKVKEGDRGTWLLHNRDQYSRAVPSHAVIHQLDFQPIAQLERVRTLVKSSRS